MKIILSGANFLVMDEPTNHLDIAAREAVEEAMDAFPGSILLVSHDRYLIDRIADRVLVFDDSGLAAYPGNYSYYKSMRDEAPAPEPAAEPAKRAAVKPERPEKKNTSPLKRRQELQKQVSRAEAEIVSLEELLTELAIRINDPRSHVDPQVSRELAQEHETAQAALDCAYQRWEEAEAAITAIDTGESPESR